MTESSRQTQERRQHLASLQLVFTVALALGMLLVFESAKRFSDALPLNAEFDATTHEVWALQEERDQLERELSYILSDAYVEIWARSEAKMVRPGENLVILLSSSLNEPMTPMEIKTTELAINEHSIPIMLGEITGNGQLWWELFFDSPLPG